MKQRLLILIALLLAPLAVLHAAAEPATTAPNQKSDPSAIVSKPDPLMPDQTKTPESPRHIKNRKQYDATTPKPDFADVSYGPSPRNNFDLWLAKSDKPTALVVYIHGGGFMTGGKHDFNPEMLKQCLDAGISFASINYRFRSETSINNLLRDCARALQFIRCHANDYHLDKRIGVTGNSAGAGTSLWLAFHDDLADPKSDDPVMRESSRVSAAAASSCQATYDVLKWKSVLGEEGGRLFERYYPVSTWPALYGLKTIDELQSEQGIKLRADVDMLGLISTDDPPVWMGVNASHAKMKSQSDVLHCSKHAEAVKARCNEIGVAAVIGSKIKERGGDSSREDRDNLAVSFLLQHLGGSSGTQAAKE